MDQKIQPSPSGFGGQANRMIDILIDHPAYLYIGNEDVLLEQTIIQLQKFFCKTTHPEELRMSRLEGGCAICYVCRKVREQQHESVLWLCPEKQYAIDDLKVIFSTISFALDPDQHFFFVLQKADLLTTTCANALLKSLEEPPAGYHFILLAQRAELVLPTIKSRCLIEHLHSAEVIPLAPLMPFFTTTSFHDPIALSKELESSNPSEWESLALIDQLIRHWSDQYKKSFITRDLAKRNQAERMISHLKKAIMQPPMPGSGKLFWKNLFLQIKEI